MTEKPAPRQTRKTTEFNGRIGFISLKWMDWALIYMTLGFIALVGIQSWVNSGRLSLDLLLRAEHYHLSRYALVLALLMLCLALYIGLYRHADVTPYFRRAVYVMFGTMVFQAALGLAMYALLGLRPGEEVHLIYGGATVLALPFFIYVETTAPKRPAMGSYMWAFAILVGILIRSISTGPPLG